MLFRYYRPFILWHVRKSHWILSSTVLSLLWSQNLSRWFKELPVHIHKWGLTGHHLWHNQPRHVVNTCQMGTRFCFQSPLRNQLYFWSKIRSNLQCGWRLLGNFWPSFDLLQLLQYRYYCCARCHQWRGAFNFVREAQANNSRILTIVFIVNTLTSLCCRVIQLLLNFNIANLKVYVIIYFLLTCTLYRHGYHFSFIV